MFSRLLLGIALLAVFPAVFATTAPVGATPGSFSVDPNGGATYTIPIAAPPGTAGMTPSIALAYTKAVDNPLVGLGFSISGLSIIHRCGRTIALDGVKGGVNYDNNDKFCLDGQRLIAISTSFCGTNGSEYRTEHESFSRICAYRDSVFTGSGPQYFRVTSKDGGTMEYGVTADSRIEAAPKSGVTQTTVRLWALNKVQDIKGNYYTVTYNENNANGEYSPARIDYTGNANASLAPYNSIRFTYATRPDVVPRYEAGSQIKVTQRLAKVESYADASIVRTYNLTYDNNGALAGATGASRLVSVQECGSDGVCLNPTTIGWDQPSTGFPRVTYWTQSDTGWASGWQLQMADVNGDGKSDLIWNGLGTNNTISVALSNGDGSFTRLADATVPGTGWGSCQMFTADVNGDGKSDLVWNCLGSNYNSIYVALSNGDGSFAPAVYSTLAGTGWNTCRLFVVDVNGDGKSDLLWNCLGTNNNTIISLSNGDGTFTPLVTQWVQPETGWGSCRLFIADIDGDGKSDLVWNCLGTLNQTYVALSNGDGTFTRVATAWAQPESGWGSCQMQTGDINGDGKSDLVWYCLTASLNRTYISLSNGDGTFTRVTTAWDQPGTGWGSYRLLIADINGDGKSDLLWSNPSSTSNRTYVALSNGDGTFAPVIATWEPEMGWSGFQMQVADINGDGKSDLIWSQLSTYNTTYADLSAYNDPSRLTQITTGLGAATNITYKPLTDNSVYTKESGSIYPYQDVQVPTYVVSRATQSDGLGGQYGTSYQYGGAKNHLTGPGWLGFRWVRTTDERSGITTYGETNQNVEAGTYGLSVLVRTEVAGRTLKTTERFWGAITGMDPAVSNTNVKFIQLNGTLDKSYELNLSIGSDLVACASVDLIYGSYGTVTRTVSKNALDCGFTNTFTKTSTNTYINDAVNWILGKLTSSSVLHEAPGQSVITRTSGFAYNAQGLLVDETVEPDSSTLWSKTSYAYDAFGNRTGVTVTGPDISARASTVTYSGRGQFAVSATNALGHAPTAPATFDPRWGNVLTQTDSNGMTMTYEYDGFGRKIKETRPDGVQTTVTFAACDVPNPCSVVPNALVSDGIAPTHTVTTQVTAAPTTKAYFDLLNRALRTETVGLNGETVTADVQYDVLARVARGSQPYKVGDSVLWDVTAYDILGRVTTLTEANGGVAATTYTGVTTTIQMSGPDIITRTRTTKSDVMNQVISVVDSLYPNQATTYAYDATGNPTRVTDPAGNVASMTYNVRGFKTQMIDPDLGLWSYSYDSLGELMSQTDAKSQTQSVSYDKLGRRVSRTTVESDGSASTGTFTYDTATKGIGKLARIDRTLNGSSEVYSYDSFGRLTTVGVTIGGTLYSTTTGYDSYSRPQTLTYPSGFAVKQVYNASGYLTEVRNNQSNALYWQANQSNARGQITHQTLGNSLVSDTTYEPSDGTLKTARTTLGGTVVQDFEYNFDVLSNLLSRVDHRQNLTESFQYDALDRLTQVTGPSPKTLQYDVLGNITQKSDVGSYSYNASGLNSVRPHAVTTTSGVLNSSYSYDANGNLLVGAGRSIGYAGFNKPSQITVNGQTTSFSYDANLKRIKKTTPTSATVYVGKFYEEVTTGGLVEKKHYIAAGGATIVYTQRNTSVNDTRYLLNDHLGSTDTITDENGNVVQHLSFDAHGKRRNGNWTDATSSIGAFDPRGFTGHEMDDEIGLINMNAREYDPVLGRFLRADSQLESMAGQGLNRYSYVQNNPLSLVDPSGNISVSWRRTLRELYRPTPQIHPARWVTQSVFGRMTFQHAQRLNSTGCALVSAFWGYWGAMCAGFGTYDVYKAHGANEHDARSAGLKAAAKSALSTWAKNKLTKDGVDPDTGDIDIGDAALNVTDRGIIGGIESKLSGGSFRSGFQSAAGMALLDIAARSMRGEEAAGSRANNGEGESDGINGDHFKLGGCRNGSTGFCIGGFQNGKGYLFAFVTSEPDSEGTAYVKSLGEYDKGGFVDHVVEAFAGPHDWLNDKMGAYSAATGNSSGGMFGGEVMSVTNLFIAAPFAAANGVSYYVGPVPEFITKGSKMR